jgi:anti-anti-sigma factor
VKSTPGFRIETSGTGTEPAIELGGELDDGTATRLAEACTRALDDPRCGRLTLDLGEISFIDSAGIRAIIQLERATRDRGVELVVLPPPEPVTELLRIAGVSNRFAIGPVERGAGTNGAYIERTDRWLAIDPAAPGEARSEMRRAAAHMGADTISVAILLISELVTNAVIHPVQAALSIGLRIIAAEDRLRAEVIDGGQGFDPAHPEPRTPNRGGRGLLLVDRLASRWGAGPYTDDPEGFRVWFELDADADAVASA